ncbi:MAG: hypothetical protein JNL11_02600 [Bdellovibrionaceae bacterium]|nr:hypothetical protein [Pseudobdellovibrionaceae bacterium]
MRLIGVICLIGLQAIAAVWTTDKTWNEQLESQYSQWVEVNWTNDVFTNPQSPLYGLKTDCADASYAMRAYFAYVNRLPFTFHRFDGSRSSQAISQFDHLRESLTRFRAFLNHVFDVTSTYTLSLDTYPIAINRQALRAGTVYVSPGIHSYQIIGVDIYGIPKTLSSTVPRETRVLFFNHGFPFYMPGDSRRNLDGFRAFKSFDDIRASNEQFQIAASAGGDFIQYQKMMILKLGEVDEPFERKVKRVKSNLCFFSRERAVQVADAYVEHQGRGGTCFGRAGFDDYSTYVRDKKLKSYFQEFKKMTAEQSWANTPTEIKKILLSVFLFEIPDDDCVVETSLVQKPYLRLADINKALDEDRLVSDPNANMLQRWGLESYAPICPIY